MARQLTVTSVVDAVVNDLTALVLAKELKPGDALTEVDVAERYDVARATAKAAIERLVADKVLDRRNHKTARVVMLGADDVRDIYNTRIYLESEVLRRLASRRHADDGARAANAEIGELWAQGVWDITDPDMRFHTCLVSALESPRTYAMYRSLAFEVKLCMSQLQGSQRLSPEIIVAEHAKLLELVEAGQGDDAAALLDEHLSRARELLAGMLGGTAGPEAFQPSSALPGGALWVG
ncbi:MAG: GntR family transcriptional regulator [Propionibacteriaceae bacterium]|jgi:DNA-binding GntR family transcriptional regulator|nr:GntR family transcriptional regulator [Propionibacteriaceae bacterium]